MSLSVRVGNVNLKNPIILASGTCGFGHELAEYMDLSRLGALSSKGLTLRPRDGNQGVRVAETPSGMLNCVGLQNPGVDAFLASELDYMVNSGAGVVVNVAGHSNEDYLAMVEKLDPYMAEPVCSAAAFKRFAELGLEAPIPAEWSAFEKESMKQYGKASAEALTLLRQGKKAQAVQLLNNTAAEIWKKAYPLAVQPYTENQK